MTERMSGAAGASTDDAAFQAVVDAAQLARRCEGYWQDRRDQADQAEPAQRWTVHYAVDVDVIALHSKPTMKAEYARIFAGLDHSDADARACLAELLGQYVLKQLPGLGAGEQGPGALILLPQHDDEFDRMKLAVAQQALVQADAAAADLEVVVDLLVRGLDVGADALGQLVERLVAQFSHVVEAMDGLSGPVRQLTRLAGLGRRLRLLAHAVPYQRERRDERLLPWIDGRDAPDREAYFALVRDWRERLQRHQPRNKPAYALMGDAIALATLQMVNERAAPLRQRLVLITGSRYVLAAAQQVALDLETGRTNFAAAFLRHPQAFIGAKDFFERQTQPPAPGDLHRSRLRIVDWLNLFFPELLQQARPVDGTLARGKSHDAAVTVDHDKLDAIIRRDDRWLNASLGTLARENCRRLTHREFPDGLLDDFAQQIAQIATDLGLAIEEPQVSAPRTQRFIDAVNQRLRSGFTVSQLQEELTSRIEDTVIQLYLETGELGVMQLIAKGDPVRGVPALRFDRGYRQAQVQSEKLCKALWADGEADRAFNLGAAYAELDEDGDREHYHAHLIHAQVYAARGHWFAARTLSRMALRVSDRIPEEHKRGRRGREAAYLMAVAERRLAQTAKDLQRCRTALRLAKAKETPGWTRCDPRFRAERMAQVAAAWQFRRFQAKRPVAWRLDALLREARSTFADLSADDPDSVQCWVRRQITTNVLVVALLAHVDGTGLMDADWRVQVRDVIDEFRARHLAPDSAPDPQLGVVFKDGLSSFVYDVAVIVFVDDSARCDAARRRLVVDQPLGLGSPPFENARKQLFLRLAGLAVDMEPGLAGPGRP